MCDDSGPASVLLEFIGDVKARYPDCIVDYAGNGVADDRDAIAKRLEKLKRQTASVPRKENPHSTEVSWSTTLQSMQRMHCFMMLLIVTW